MRKNIAIGVFVITTLLFFVYAFVQKLEADKLRVEVENLYNEARRQELLAKEAQAMAEIQRVSADHQRILTEKAIADCEKTKR